MTIQPDSIQSVVYPHQMSHFLWGDSPKILNLKKNISLVAQADLPVLLTGAAGAGKKYVAQMIHQMCKRRCFPLIPLNCEETPKNLIDFELFGCEAGVLPGNKEYTGKLEQAQGGVVILEEVSALSPITQARLIKVLENKKIMSRDGVSFKEIDVRIMATTREDIEEAVHNRGFRKDLYYHLNAIPLHMPSLKERTEDIVDLFLHFCSVFSKKFTPG